MIDTIKHPILARTFFPRSLKTKRALYNQYDKFDHKWKKGIQALNSLTPIIFLRQEKFSMIYRSIELEPPTDSSHYLLGLLTDNLYSKK
jgi:hypothetical protein